MFNIMTSLLLIFANAWAQSPAAANGKTGPCAQIEADCKKNGYVVGEAAQGKGLWWDCMCPLIAPDFPEPAKNALSVPSDSSLVPSCRTHPFGQKIIARCQAMAAKKAAKSGK